MTAFVRRHPVGAFLIAAYGIALLVYAVPILSDIGLGILPIQLPGIAPFLLILTFLMVGVVYAITAIVDGRDGVRELRQRMFRFRISPAWYLAALLVLPGSALVAALALEGTGLLSALADDPGVVLSGLIDIAVAVILLNFWEEFAWSGFVLHRLQPRFGPVRATVLTTWAHAAIHVPLILVAGGLSDNPITLGMYPFYLAALFVMPLGSRIVTTWLYNRSGHSVPIAGLSHSAWNLATGSALFPALVPGYDPVWSYAGFGGAALVVIVATRGRLGYHSSDAVRSTPRPGALASADASVH